ncbi:hypothetical protein V1477_014886 [Vespula maculifrons]|uniref:Uncharacterized protein n=1 Tax=Vespula maculifrons TaxID=7453 RepID=A0ABD2BJ26_VESMC
MHDNGKKDNNEEKKEEEEKQFGTLKKEPRSNLLGVPSFKARNAVVERHYTEVVVMYEPHVHLIAQRCLTEDLNLPPKEACSRDEGVLRGLTGMI